MNEDEQYMNRAITLARRGIGHVSPNPPVGAVIVYDGKILGEGYHMRYGHAHAEVNAVADVNKEDLPLLSSATIYVTLEPCSFYGKTPPCVDLLLKHSFKKVVIATEDPHPKVSGSSVEKLRNAGIEVVVGVCKKEAEELAHAFITHHKKNRPYYILKWAQTRSGYIGSKSGPVKISNSVSQRLSHKWRSEIPGILIGVGTAIIDNPQLTDRYHGGPQPTIIIYDPLSQLPADHDLLRRKNVIHAHGELLQNSDSNPHASCIDRLNALLLDQGINEVLIEGGRSTLQAWIDCKTWDEIRVFIAPDIAHSLDVRAPVIQAAITTSRVELSDNFLDIFHPEP